MGLNRLYNVIKAVKPAKNLTDRRKSLDEMIDTVKTQYKKSGVKEGSEASKIKKKFWKKSANIHDKYEKGLKDLKKAKSTEVKKAVGAGAATVAGAVGAPLDPGDLIFSPLPDFILFLLA